MMLVVGRAGSLTGELPIGCRVVVAQADGDDGASRAYGRVGVAEADPGLSHQLRAALGGSELAGSWSTDVPFRVTGERLELAGGAGGVIEMEATTLFTVGRLRGIRVGLGVVVSDLRSDLGWRVGDGPAVLASVDELVEGSLSVLDSTDR
jgi:uridine phosphorylase